MVDASFVHVFGSRIRSVDFTSTILPQSTFYSRVNIMLYFVLLLYQWSNYRLYDTHASRKYRIYTKVWHTFHILTIEIHLFIYIYIFLEMKWDEGWWRMMSTALTVHCSLLILDPYKLYPSSFIIYNLFHIS